VTGFRVRQSYVKNPNLIWPLHDAAQVNTVWDYSTGLYYITPNKEHTFCTAHVSISDGTVIVPGGERGGDAAYYAVSPLMACCLLRISAQQHLLNACCTIGQLY
jgi:hypothetical protein